MTPPVGRHQAQRQGRLIVGVEIGPVHRDDDFPILANGLTNPLREQATQIDARVAKQAVDLLDGVFGFQTSRRGKRQSDRRDRQRRRMKHARNAIVERRNSFGVQFPLKKFANPRRNRVTPKVPNSHRRPREPNLTAFGASIMAFPSQSSK
jgi:hypothetical protein